MDRVSGRWHHVVVGSISDVSVIFTVYIFKVKCYYHLAPSSILRAQFHMSIRSAVASDMSDDSKQRMSQYLYREF